MPGFKLIKPSFLKDSISISPQKFIHAKMEPHCRSEFSNLIISNVAMVELDEGKNLNKQNPNYKILVLYFLEMQVCKPGGDYATL